MGSASMTAHLAVPYIVQPQEHLSSQALLQTLLPCLDMLHPSTESLRFLWGNRWVLSMTSCAGVMAFRPNQLRALYWYDTLPTSVLSALGSLKYSPYASPCPYFEKSLKVHPLNLSNQLVIHSSCFFTLDPGVDLCLELWT
ncbi:hypothetical protein mRhiFer1_009447 [Rhinolophus ferrumequinum]|uniref:Uncharacterized protein n=1 Tax=Rhinolophus ferrumequinum TaxID=59479 RepID=A0A7J7RJ27_RHIFE|nr:hypothetical protein mRhiFer1_009447 [Rhinolophus ferrumequinum]